MLRRRSTNQLVQDGPVVVAGGGVAALEAVLALRAATSELPITMIAPQPRFTYRPLSVLESFGAARAKGFEMAAFARDQGVTLVPDRLAGVDADRRIARTETGEQLRYSALLLAVGGEAAQALPGASIFQGSADVAALDGLLDHLEFGQSDSIAFVNPVAGDWALPLYELALLTRHRLKERGHGDTSVSIITAEKLPLASLGLEAADTAQMLLRAAGVQLRCGVVATAVRDRHVVLERGAPIPADHAVTMPRRAPAPIHGIPQDRDGFVAIDEHAAVLRVPAVFAAGDVTAGYPKQGGIAARQAAAAASAILAGLGLAEAPEPFEPELHGVLLTPGVLERAAAGERWQPPTKIVAEHLARYLGTREADSEDPARWAGAGRRPLPTEIALG